MDDQNDSIPSENIVSDIKNTEATIISQLGFGEATDDKKREMLEAIDKRVAIALTKVMLEKASPEEAEVLRVALEEGGNLESKVSDIVSKNPDLQEEIRKALADLWEKILKESEAARS